MLSYGIFGPSLVLWVRLHSRLNLVWCVSLRLLKPHWLHTESRKQTMKMGNHKRKLAARVAGYQAMKGTEEGSKGMWVWTEGQRKLVFMHKPGSLKK